jgi:protoheme IX farnesyltransferase
MLPVVKGEKVTVDQIWIYTLITVPFSLLLVFPLQSSGILYAIAALVLGGIFIQKAWDLKQNPFDKPSAKSMFKYSILYMMLLCTAMVVDSLPAVHNVSAMLTTTIASFIV